jgi:hypothetical protein
VTSIFFLHFFFPAVREITQFTSNELIVYKYISFKITLKKKSKETTTQLVKCPPFLFDILGKKKTNCVGKIVSRK